MSPSKIFVSGKRHPPRKKVITFEFSCNVIQKKILILFLSKAQWKNDGYFFEIDNALKDYGRSESKLRSRNDEEGKFKKPDILIKPPILMLVKF